MKPTIPNAETEQRRQPPKAVRCGAWFDAMRESSKDFVKEAMADCHAGPKWQPVLERVLVKTYEQGFKDGMAFQGKEASNDQAQARPE